MLFFLIVFIARTGESGVFIVRKGERGEGGHFPRKEGTGVRNGESFVIDFLLEIGNVLLLNYSQE